MGAREHRDSVGAWVLNGGLSYDLEMTVLEMDFFRGLVYRFEISSALVSFEIVI